MSQDERIQELLESNNEYLERARKAEGALRERQLEVEALQAAIADQAVQIMELRRGVEIVAGNRILELESAILDAMGWLKSTGRTADRVLVKRLEERLKRQSSARASESSGGYPLDKATTDRLMQPLRSSHTLPSDESWADVDKKIKGL